MTTSTLAKNAMRTAKRAAKRIAKRTARRAAKLAMVAGSLTGTMAYADSSWTTKLQLSPPSNAEEAEQVYGKIRTAARHGCDMAGMLSNTDALRGMEGYRECVDKAVANAVAQLHSGALSAYYQSQLPGHAKTRVAQGAPLVNVLTPQITQIASTVSFKGEISARADVPVGVDGDAGRIEAVHVEAGDHVKKGQVLAQLDDSRRVPEVTKLAAMLEQARAQAALSAAQYRHAHVRARTFSGQELERRRASAAADAAGVKVAAAQLAEAQARLARTRIVAPVDGVVLVCNAQIGQIAGPGGEALFRIASGGELEMRAEVAEADLPAVKVGQEAQVQLPGVMHPIEGQVRLLGAVIDPKTQLGEVRITLLTDPELRPGAAASGAVHVAGAERPVLPKAAVLTDAHGTYVYVVDGKGQVQRRAVQVGGTVEAGVVIESGLAPTERVVTTTAGIALHEGEKVRFADATAPEIVSSR